MSVETSEAVIGGRLRMITPQSAGKLSGSAIRTAISDTEEAIKNCAKDQKPRFRNGISVLRAALNAADTEEVAAVVG